MTLTVCAGLAGAMPLSAQAVPMLDFVVDGDNSSVSITDQYGGGALCSLSNCGIEASLVDGLGDTSFSLAEGEFETFDFLEFTVAGTTGLPPRLFDIEATLAFLEPTGADTTSEGAGAARLFRGSIVAGVLTWFDVPTVIELDQGSIIGVDFQGGFTLHPGDRVTTQAGVAGLDIVRVPLPSTVWLMALALLMMLGLRRLPQARLGDR